MLCRARQAPATALTKGFKVLQISFLCLTVCLRLGCDLSVPLWVPCGAPIARPSGFPFSTLSNGQTVTEL